MQKTAKLPQQEALDQFETNCNEFLGSKLYGNKKKFVKIGQRKVDLCQCNAQMQKTGKITIEGGTRLI